MGATVWRFAMGQSSQRASERGLGPPTGNPGRQHGSLDGYRAEIISIDGYFGPAIAGVESR